MPVYRQVEQGQPPRYVRPPYRAESYTVPEGWVDALRRQCGNDTIEWLLYQDEPGGNPTRGQLSEMERFERDGKRWVLLKCSGSIEWCIEVELTEASGGLGEIREVSPERAWEVARRGDAAHGVTVGVVDVKKMF